MVDGGEAREDEVGVAPVVYGAPHALVPRGVEPAVRNRVWAWIWVWVRVGVRDRVRVRVKVRVGVGG